VRDAEVFRPNANDLRCPVWPDLCHAAKDCSASVADRQGVPRSRTDYLEWRALKTFRLNHAVPRGQHSVNRQPDWSLPDPTSDLGSKHHHACIEPTLMNDLVLGISLRVDDLHEGMRRTASPQAVVHIMGPA